MLLENINRVIQKRCSLAGPHSRSEPEKAESLGEGIPTLATGIFRKTSPMLLVRFENFGRWKNATHGDWLSIRDMETLWQVDLKDERLNAIRLQALAMKDNWPNHVYGLFREERLSLFAGDGHGNESIYLVWLDFEDEPEIWVYDSNGESRYKDLNEYLACYLSDDVSAAQRSWRA